MLLTKDQENVVQFMVCPIYEPWTKFQLPHELVQFMSFVKWQNGPLTLLYQFSKFGEDWVYGF